MSLLGGQRRAALPSLARLASLDRATGWLNSPPLTTEGLLGKVVLVDFWTLTCINWLRTEPWVRAWSQAYRDDGLVVIGVHTPEFSFEHEIERVRQATRERRIDYPVAVDNDYQIWEAFDNHYWPALYFVDRDGIIRDHHFGEGRYEHSERAIQQLLGVERGLVRIEAVGVEAEADWDHLRSPETYLGYARRERMAPREDLHLNQWGLAGEWTTGEENVVLEQAGGSIAYRFHARDAHLVLSNPTPEPIPFRCFSTARYPTAHTESTSTSTGTAYSATAACTSLCARTARSTSERWRSASSRGAPKRTYSRSGRSVARDADKAVPPAPNAHVKRGWRVAPAPDGGSAGGLRQDDLWPARFRVLLTMEV